MGGDSRMSFIEGDGLADRPIIRNKVRSIDAKVRSGYPKSLRRWGYSSQVQIEGREPMRSKLASCFVAVKKKLEMDVPGIIFNAPEIFPINHQQCIVLITGWKLETILVS